MKSRHRIERQIELKAPIEKVWSAITKAEELRKWFGDVAELELREGGRGQVGWSEFGSISELVVESVEPPSHFAFSWSAVANAPFDGSLATRVDIYLEDLGETTRLKVEESGFDELPESIGRSVFEENRSGWGHELEDLEAYLASTGA